MPEAPDSPAPFTEENVDEVILMTQAYRYAGTFLLTIYDVNRVDMEMLGRLTVLPESYKSMVIDRVREAGAAYQEEIGGGLLQWKLPPLGRAAVEKRLKTDLVYGAMGI